MEEKELEESKESGIQSSHSNIVSPRYYKTRAAGRKNVTFVMEKSFNYLVSLLFLTLSYPLTLSLSVSLFRSLDSMQSYQAADLTCYRPGTGRGGMQRLDLEKYKPISFDEAKVCRASAGLASLSLETVVRRL
jgi:hypothetical protein